MQEDTLLICRKTGEDSDGVNFNEHILLTALIFILICFDWCETENQQFMGFYFFPL